MQSTFSEILMEATGLRKRNYTFISYCRIQSFLSPSIKTAEQIPHNHWMNNNAQVKFALMISDVD